MLELELKAAVPDVEALRERLRAAGAEVLWRGMMRDRRFDRDGDFTRRDEVVRVRAYENADGTETVLGWKGRTSRSPEGYKAREELELPSSCSAAEALRFIEALGFTVVHAIDRRIEVWAWRGATLRIEWYPRMDVLLEVEGPADLLEAAIAVTGLPRDAFSADALSAFAARWRERTGRASVLSEAELAGSAPEWPAA